MKYFLPDWEDRLDPEFDFINDEYSQGHKVNPYKHDVYIHQILNPPPYDGILFSLSVFQSKISLTMNGQSNTYCIRNATNIRSYLKIPSDSSLEVMGDCGAFGYVNEEVPPLPFYSVENVANLYEQLGFNYGVSVDHLVVDHIFTRNEKTGRKEKQPLSLEQKKKRIQLSLENAERFYNYHKKQGFKFIPIGSAQGYDLDTYVNSVKNLISIGYNYIGIGGLVQYESSFIINILKAIQPIIEEKCIHLFGILRPDNLVNFQSFGVTSLDSASYLRKAWLRSGQNYLAINGKWYTAIRVPQSDNPRMRVNAKNGYSEQRLKKLEHNALKSLIEYDSGKASLEDTLNIVLKYDQLLLRNGDDGKNLRKKYERTLRDLPWKSCSCKMCKELGVQVVVFRGCNRNKRRGFHNTWIFYQRLKQIRGYRDSDHLKEDARTDR